MQNKSVKILGRLQNGNLFILSVQLGASTLLITYHFIYGLQLEIKFII